MTSSSSLSQIQCQGKHGIHIKVSNIHRVPLETDNKLVVCHCLYSLTLNSETFQHSIANDSATLQHVLQCYRNLSARSGHIQELITELLAFFRVEFGVYTATFRMSLRECMQIHAAHLPISDAERFPKLAKLYRQPFCRAHYSCCARVIFVRSECTTVLVCAVRQHYIHETLIMIEHSDIFF